MERREFFWVDTDKSLRLAPKIGLDGLGLLSVIVSEFYCGEPIKDSWQEVSRHCRCSELEWSELSQRLIDAGEIKIVDGLVVPIGDWHRAEPHS